MPTFSLASPSVASVGVKAERILRSAVPRTVRSRVCLSAGVRCAVPVTMSGLPPAMNDTSRAVRRRPAVQDRGTFLGDADARQREIGLVEGHRAGDAIERRARDPRVQRGRHGAVDSGEPGGIEPRREGRFTQAFDAELGEAVLPGRKWRAARVARLEHGPRNRRSAADPAVLPLTGEAASPRASRC